MAARTGMAGRSDNYFWDTANIHVVTTRRSVRKVEEKDDRDMD